MVYSCEYYWISTHYRLQYKYHDESVDKINNFNQLIKEYFNSNSCGLFNTIDIYNMTKSLNNFFNLNENVSLSKELSYDSIHWGMEVNLIKAQIILNSILNS